MRRKPNLGIGVGEGVRGKAFVLVCYCSEEEGAEKAAYCREATGARWRRLGEVMWRGGGEERRPFGELAPGGRPRGRQRLAVPGRLDAPPPRVVEAFGGDAVLWSVGVGLAPRGGRTAL